VGYNTIFKRAKIKELLEQGKTAKEIAGIVNLSIPTVYYHMRHIKETIQKEVESPKPITDEPENYKDETGRIRRINTDMYEDYVIMLVETQEPSTKIAEEIRKYLEYKLKEKEVGNSDDIPEEFVKIFDEIIPNVEETAH